MRVVNHLVDCEIWRHRASPCTCSERERPAFYRYLSFTWPEHPVLRAWRLQGSTSRIIRFLRPCIYSGIKFLVTTTWNMFRILQGVDITGRQMYLSIWYGRPGRSHCVPTHAIARTSNLLFFLAHQLRPTALRPLDP